MIIYITIFRELFVNNKSLDFHNVRYSDKLEFRKNGNWVDAGEIADFIKEFKQRVIDFYIEKKDDIARNYICKDENDSNEIPNSQELSQSVNNNFRTLHAADLTATIEEIEEFKKYASLNNYTEEDEVNIKIMNILRYREPKSYVYQQIMESNEIIINNQKARSRMIHSLTIQPDMERLPTEEELDIICEKENREYLQRIEAMRKQHELEQQEKNQIEN